MTTTFPDMVMWQWARSSDMVTWEDIEGAEMKVYTPVTRGRGNVPSRYGDLRRRGGAG